MTKYVKFDDVYNMLHGIGGCDAEPHSFADGWDKAIDTAIQELEKIPAVDVSSDKIDLKPCPFCGKENVYSEFNTDYVRGYVIRIGCNECDYALKFSYLPENEHMSLKEVLGSMEQAAEKWNTRSDKI